MKIGIVGCGAVGSYYGAMLARYGFEVHFLLRSDFSVVDREGVRVISPNGNFAVRPHCALKPQQIGVCDWVLIALKTTANELFEPLISPMVGANTAVMTLQNGLGNEEALARIFPSEQILGGLCFVCINRTAPGVIEHLAHGRIAMGEFQRGSQPRTHQLAEAFRSSGVPCDVSESLARTHWEKLVWNIPFNGLGVASAAGWDALDGHGPVQRAAACLSTDRLLSDPGWQSWVRGLMREVIQAARGLGHEIPWDYEEVQVTRTFEMGAYRASTLIDFERGEALEVESLFGEPLRQAKANGAEMPRLSRLYDVIRRLDDRR